MNGRSSLVTFFIFLFLAVIIVLQILSMVQSDRFYERLNRVLERLASSGPFQVAGGPRQPRAVDLPMPEYIGDEGDWLIFRLGGEPATLNPVTAKDAYARWICVGSVFERLLEYDFDEAKLKPWLAESYQVSEDGLEITICLRDDIYFSDGKPITTEDVIFTYETIMNPGVDADNVRNYYDNIKEVIKIDERVVKFVFKEPYWKSIEVVGLLEVLPRHIYQFTDAADFNKHRSNPVGSGPYLFQKWDVGRQVVLRRNERYWGHKPRLERIVYRFISNELAALQALRSHEVDMMIPTPEQFAEMASDEEFDTEFRSLVYWNPGIPYFYTGWNQATPFFKDRRVRLAMTHIVNREAIVEHLLKGNARIVTGPFYINGPQNDPSIEPWPYDLERARQLLDEAGWIDSDGDGVRDKDGIPFRFNYSIVSGSVLYERLAKLFKDDAAKVGVDVIADPLEWSVFIERLNKRDFEASTSGWGGTIMEDPYQIWHSSQIEGRGSNCIGFANAEADAIMEQARRTMDDQIRNALYYRFHRIVYEEQPYTFLFTRPTFRFLDRRFENVVVHKLGLNESEWYVPKEKQRYK